MWSRRGVLLRAAGERFREHSQPSYQLGLRLVTHPSSRSVYPEFFFAGEMRSRTQSAVVPAPAAGACHNVHASSLAQACGVQLFFTCNLLCMTIPSTFCHVMPPSFMRHRTQTRLKCALARRRACALEPGCKVFFCILLLSFYQADPSMDNSFLEMCKVAIIPFCKSNKPQAWFFPL